MLGIPGLDSLGLVHTLFGIATLILGGVVLLGRKGTRRHRRLGQAYFVGMLGLNGTALMIYDLYGYFGPFHIAALVSLATVAGAFGTVYLRRPRAAWMRYHAELMCWSYVGLLAAFVSEIATHVPGVGFGYGVAAATIGIVCSGALLIRTQVPRILQTIEERRTG